MRSRKMLELIVLFAVFTTVWFGSISSSFAHSDKERVTPEAGSIIPTSPPAITMSFSAPMRITLFTLTDASGRDFKVERTDKMTPVKEFSATPEKLPPGSYTAKWRGMSADGHAMEGSWNFEVQ
ncbi:copper resistance CopC family protein [Indioceanicola profundi]|uniref:copper resistance CopC family protein n=1 Tax=Indioceanicola profundi TaxID=2220096 RepID=UPI001CEC7679|nr:copper resistance CopC family protein [Indioceanicola profundi]